MWLCGSYIIFMHMQQGKGVVCMMIKWERSKSFVLLAQNENCEWSKLFKTPNFVQTFAMAKTAVVSWKMFLCWFTFEILSTELCVCVRDKTKIEAKNTSTEKGSYAEKKCCLNIERKKVLCSLPWRSAIYATESSIYANMCCVHYKRHQWSKKQNFSFSHPPTTCIFRYKLYQLASDDLLQYLIGFIITFSRYSPLDKRLNGNDDNDNDSVEAFQLRFPVFI